MANILERFLKAVRQKFPRFPKQGFSHWPLWELFGSKPETWRNEDATQSSLVMSGVRWVGSRLPEAPLTVQEPKGDESQIIPSHPLIKFLAYPNPYMSMSTLWKAFAYSWILKGDVYFLKFRNRAGRVAELWYEPYWNVKPRWVSDYQGTYIFGRRDDPDAFITYYELDRDGVKYRMEVEDVLHFRDGIDPKNSRCGLSPIATILRELFSDSQVADFAGQLLANGGVPPYIVSIDSKLGNLNTEDVKRFKAEMLRQTSGKHSGEPLVVANATAQTLGFSPDQLDLRVSRYIGEERFSAVIGIPSEVLQLGSGKEHSIYNNVSEAKRDAAQGYLVPLWWHIAQELTVQLLPEFDDNPAHFVEHDISEVQALQEDENTKHQRIGADFQNGLITRAQALVELHLPADSKPDRSGLDDVYYVKTGARLIPANQPPQMLPEKDPLADVPMNGGKPVEELNAKT